MPSLPSFARVTGLCFFLFCAVLDSSTAQSVLQQRLYFSVENQPVSVALVELSKASGVAIGFSEALFQTPSRVTVKATDERLSTLLDHVLDGTNVGWRLADGQILLFRKPPPEQPISGFVEDADTGERLIGAVVVDRTTGRMAVSNNYGFFSLNVRSGQEARLAARFVGYNPTEASGRPGNSRQPLVLALKSNAGLSEITVSDDASVRHDNAPFYDRLESNLDRLPLDRLPSLAGERDLMRSAALLPGVGSDLDGLGGWSVRGGDVSQNRLVVDDALVFSPGHGMGLFSLFVPESVRSAQLWKGDAPARLGGAASSVLEVRTREGNIFRPSASASVGWLAGHLSVELPLPHERGAVLFSARRSLAGPIFRQMSRQAATRNGRSGESDYRFSDLHFKINRVLGSRDRLYLSLFSGGDFFADSAAYRQVFTYDSLDYSDSVVIHSQVFSQQRWKNSFASLRWNHLFSDRFFSNTTFTTSRLNLSSSSRQRFEFEGFNQLGLQGVSQSQLRDFSAKTDLDWLVSDHLTVRSGAQVSLTRVLPFYYQSSEEGLGAINWVEYGPDSTLVLGEGLKSEQGVTVALHSEADWSPWPSARVRAGFRFESFVNQGRRWLLPQPRFFWEERWKKGLSSWLSINWQAQTLKTVSPSGVESVSDLWLLSNKGVPPQRMLQVALGSGVERRNWAFRADFFVKKIYNANEYLLDWSGGDPSNTLPVEYVNGIRQWETEVGSGLGRAWGSELLLEKRTGRTTGWVSLTLARSERRFEQLNEDQWFPARFDRLANCKMVAIHQFSRHWSLSAAWQWATGDAISSLLVYSDTKINLLDLHLGGPQVVRIGNGDYRQPNQHRLDVSGQYRWQWRRLEQVLTLGAYNAYNRQNTHFTFWVQGSSVEQAQPIRNTVSGLPLLPYLTWSARF